MPINENLANWFAGSHEDVTDETGAPKRLYVGTLSDFGIFDRLKMSVSGDHGQGFYATNNPADASVNYASKSGPDYISKLHRIADSLRDDDEEDLSEDDLYKLAESQLPTHHEGAVMPIHMALKNPVILGGKNETYYTYEEPYNEKTDEYGEPTGTLIQLINGVEEAGRQFQSPTGEIVDDLISHARDYGHIPASRAEKIIKDGFQHAYDDFTGDYASNEAWRTSVEEAGHDGIIDHTVDTKFGSSRRGFGGARIPGMHGVEPETTHYIAFDNRKIKSATGNQGTYDPNNPDITKAEGGTVDLSQYQDSNNFGLYSHAAETAAALPQAKGTPEQFKSMLLKQGVKPVEIENSNYDETFAGRPSVTKDELVQHFRQNMPKIQEHVLGAKPAYPEELKNREQAIINSYQPRIAELWSKSDDYSLPSEERAKARDALQDLYDQMQNHIDSEIPERGKYLDVTPTKYHNYTIPGGENYREVVLKAPPTEDSFRHPHWPGVENPLAHIRMSDRTGPNGEKILHVEELQSDWGQNARDRGIMDPKAKKAYDEHMREYRALGERHAQLELQHGVQDLPHKQQIEAVPELKEISDRMAHMYMNEPDKPQGMPYNPYITSTGAWTDLALKRVLHEAAHGGYDKVVWTPGEHQADRFDLSNHLSGVVAEPTRHGTIDLHLYDHENKEDPFDTIENIHPDELHKHVGKELADRILGQIKFPEKQQVWRIQDKHGGSFKTTTSTNYDRVYDFFEGYPENVRKGLEIVSFMEPRGGHGTELRGLDLKIGGEGMKGFYDKIVPKQLMALAKKHDPEAWLGQTAIETPQGSVPVHSMDITPKMRDSILRGQKAFRDGGAVDGDDEDGITAYHGSPHSFERFDTSRIGTGEGSQAFGHGLYFAQAEPVAHTYRGDPEERYRRYSGHMDPKEEYAFDLASRSGDIRDFDIMMGLAKKYGENISFDEAAELARKAISKRGHMYEVHIKAHPDDFLDWDRDINHHSNEAVADLLPGVRHYDRVMSTFDKPPTGEEFYNRLADIAGSPESASRLLHQSGIHGIKYLDAGSRGSGEGSRNYVVFDDKLVNVKRKYAKGGIVEDENGKDTDESYEEGRSAAAGNQNIRADKGRNPSRGGKLLTGPGGAGPWRASSVKPVEAGPVVDRALMVISRKAKSRR